MLRWLTLFFAVSTVILSVVLASLYFPSQPIQRSDEDIVFPWKVFSNTDEWVSVKGTLTADWLPYKNNTYSILCIPKECMIASVEQIGPRQISSISGPIVFPAKRWTDYEVVAESDALCVRSTIILDRKIEAVLWVDTPINQTAIACKGADSVIRKATIENSIFWQRNSPQRDR